MGDIESLANEDYFSSAEEIELLLEEKRYRQTSRWSRFSKRIRQVAWPCDMSIYEVANPFNLVRLLLYYTIALFIFILPSFITGLFSRFASSSNTIDIKPRKVLHQTAYLNGVRGIAALVVYIFHWSYLWFPFLRQGYESPSAETANSFFQLPGVRVLHSGRAAVAIFFVISGYVVTLKTLSTIHAGEPGRALETLSGSLLRRPLRLYLPIIAQMLIIMALVRWDFLQNDTSGTNVPPRFSTLGEQLRHWWFHLCNTVNPFHGIIGRQNIYGNPYDEHLWSIPTEFKGSLVVFSFLLAFAFLQRWLHLCIVGLCIAWLTGMGELDMTLFCSGMFLAELGLVFPAEGEPTEMPTDGSQDSTQKKGVWRKRLSKILRHATATAMFIVALHLMSYPEKGGSGSLGFQTLSLWTPSSYAGREVQMQWFWNSVGSVLFILSLMYSPPVSTVCPSLPRAVSFFIARLFHRPSPQYQTCDIENHCFVDEEDVSTQRQPLLQRPFTNALAQYLGRISYSIYLVHGTVNHTVGTRYLNPAFSTWRDAEQAAHAEGSNPGPASAALARAGDEYMLRALWATIVNTFVLFWVSDVFWRAVDAHAVRLARWLGKKLMGR